MPEEIMSKGYEPGKVEDKWYDYWTREGLFNAEVPSDKPPFCIVIPPPNVTGSLHMGHALNKILKRQGINYRKNDKSVDLINFFIFCSIKFLEI